MWPLAFLFQIRLFSPELTKKEAAGTGADDMASITGARLDRNHNLEWVIDVAPNEERELSIKWAAEYPNSETLTFRELDSPLPGGR